MSRSFTPSRPSRSARSSRSSWASPADVAVAASVAVAAATSSLASTVVLDNTSGLTVGPGSAVNHGINSHSALISFQTSTSGTILDTVSLNYGNYSAAPRSGRVTISLIETTTNAYTGQLLAQQSIDFTLPVMNTYQTFDIGSVIGQTTLDANKQYSLYMDQSLFTVGGLVVRAWGSGAAPAMTEQGGFDYLGSWINASGTWNSSTPWAIQLTATTNAVPGAGGLAGVFALAVASRRRRREELSA